MAYKYQRVYELMKPEIEAEWRAGRRKLPTETILKDKYQVSISTIRQAVDRLEAEGFLSRIQGSGCYINGALFSSDRITELYLLAYGVSEDSPYFRHFLRMTTPPVLEEGFHFSLRMIPERAMNPEQFRGELRRIGQMFGIDCVLTLAGHYTESMIEDMQKLNKPLLFLNDFPTSKLNYMDVNQICGDNRFVASECVRYLEGKGHRSIAIVTRKTEISYINNFVEGAKKAAGSAQVEAYSLPDIAFKHQETEMSPKAFKTLTAQLKNHSAVIFYGINTCLFVNELKQNGVAIPEELSLLSADENIPFINCIVSDFTPYFQSVFGALRRIVKDTHGTEKHRIKLPMEIIDRQTVKQLNP